MLNKFSVAFAALATTIATPVLADSFTGAGATFPAPAYQAWAAEYKAKGGDALNYQAIGSGGGIRQITAKTVDFGASDKPLLPAELAKNGLVQFPTLIGGVVPIINLPGLQSGQLKLTGALMGEIFMGNVKRWDDARIKALNPALRLPPLPITVVHRSDGSGTSFIFTSFLSQTSAAWANRVGASDAVNWPTGLGGKGNDGVNAFVKQTMGSIGYVEYAYARKGGVAYALVQNRQGQFPKPEAGAFAAAAAGAPWGRAPGNYIMLVNQPGPKSWPISGATFILMHANQANPAKGASVLRFVDWAFKNGDATASKLDYVPLPAPVKNQIRGQWAQVKAGGKPVYNGK